MYVDIDPEVDSRLDSHLFSVRLLSTGLRILLGEHLQKRFRILRYLVRQWTHCCVSLRGCGSVWQQRQAHSVNCACSSSSRLCSCPLLCGQWPRRAEICGDSTDAVPGQVVFMPVIVRTAAQTVQSSWPVCGGHARRCATTGACLFGSRRSAGHGGLSFSSSSRCA